MIDTSITAVENAPVKPYVKPVIVHELKLETRAGSPLGIDSPFDPLGIDPTQN